MNNLDKQYLNLLQDILDNGSEKTDRTGTGTISVFGRSIRHKMSDGFPLLTSKKIAWKQVVTELLWFLRGETNIQSLVKQGNYIWVGDSYAHYLKTTDPNYYQLNREEFIFRLKESDDFAKLWGEMGPIYGKQWRDWKGFKEGWHNVAKVIDGIEPHIDYLEGIDQIQNIIDTLKTNPDSRRMMVNAWNVSDLDDMKLPPCHYGFQVYTRKLTDGEIIEYYYNNIVKDQKWKEEDGRYYYWAEELNLWFEHSGSDVFFTMRPHCPERAISLMWNQRSVDTPLGLPFNIASYGLLLLMFANEVNMIPDELIGNLGDVHIYLNQIDGVKEQISRESLKLPTVIVNGGINAQLEDIKLINYTSHDKISFPLSN